MITTVEQYIDAISLVIVPLFAPDQMYHGKEGALRLAHELGFGLADFCDSDINRILPELYSRLLVINCFTLSGVPLDNKEWIRTIKDSIDSRRERRKQRLQQTI